MGIGVALVLVAIVGGVALMLRVAGPTPEVIAPRLSPDFGAALLMRAGFPVTGHNLAAVNDRLGRDFLAAVTAVDSRIGAAVAARCEADRHDGAGWPQRVLDEIAADGHVAVTTLVHHCPTELLATAGTGRGFFGGSVFEPLPAPAAVRPAVPAPRASAPIESAPIESGPIEPALIESAARVVPAA